MADPPLPERASIDYLEKLAKDRLREFRLKQPLAKLATAQLSVARDYGFPSWRALKASVDRQQATDTTRFFEACAEGDVAALHSLFAHHPNLLRSANPAASHGGWTGLHMAAQRGHLEAVRLLLEHGADPNARESGDNTYPLHWAATNGHLEIVRALLDAGGDPNGIGDVHELDAIGWATCLCKPGSDNSDVASILVQRGARHHIFSAIALGDLDLIRSLVGQDPNALDRQMSRFEHGQTPLHFAMSRNRYDILDLLIESGADLDATDANGHTIFEIALLRGDREAITRLRAAGANEPARSNPSAFRPNMSKLADSVTKCVPMIYVPDVAAALRWYTSIGFKEIARYAADGIVNFGMVSFGKAEIMLNVHGKPREHDVSLWLYTGRVDDLYQLLKSRQIEAALAGAAGANEGVDFVEHIHDTFYGARQFGIRDLNGYTLYFIQQLER